MLSNADDDKPFTQRPEYEPLLQLLNHDPLDARTHFELGFLALRFNDWDFATTCFSQVTRLAPTVEAGFFNLGNAQFALKQYGQAVEAYKRAYDLEPAWGTLNNIGNALAAAGSTYEAIDVFREALGIAHGNATDALCIYGNLGTAHSQVGDWQAAADCFRQAFERSSPQTKILNNYLRSCLWLNDAEAGIKAIQSMAHKSVLDHESFILASQLHQRMHRYGSAMSSLLEALEKSPQDTSVLTQIAMLNFARGRRTESLFCFESVRDAISNSMELQSHWIRLLNYQSEVTVEEAFDETVAMTNRQMNPDPVVSLAVAAEVNESANGDETASRVPPEPLRIGFLFNDLQSNEDVYSFWLKPILLHADRSKFEFFLYSDGVPTTTLDRGTPDDDKWVETAHLTNQHLVDRIRGDQIDVLIDLIGHGLHTRLKVFAERPAKVQVAWAGYLATTGLKQMDYILADPNLLPESLSPYFSETPIRFPKTYMAFMPPSQEIPKSAPPFHDNGWITFGSNASPEKISDEVIDAWSKILLRADSAMLRLVHDAFKDQGVQIDFQSWFQNRGVAANRLLFGIPTEQPDKWARYRLLDIALDPFPVNDPRAALESVYMGVPVVCLRSDRMAGRAVASILAQLNLPCLVSDSNAEYVENALNIAHDLPQLRRFQETLRSDLVDSPVCDAISFAKAFQDAMYHLWSRSRAK